MSPTARQDPLGAAVRRLRQERGMTQEAMALKAHVTLSALSRIERGVASPAYSTLMKLADALEIPLSELFNAAEDGDA